MYPVEDGKSAQTAIQYTAIAAEPQDNPRPCGLSLDDARITGPSDTAFVRARDTNEHRSIEISSTLNLTPSNIFIILSLPLI
jgi:hypothetical protein